MFARMDARRELSSNASEESDDAPPDRAVWGIEHARHGDATLPHHRALVRKRSEAMMAVIASLPALADTTERQVRIGEVEQHLVYGSRPGGSLLHYLLDAGMIATENVERERLSQRVDAIDHLID
jgi:hypothetical protein